MDNFKCKSFNQDMVKAIMAGNKTQTRRPLKIQPLTSKSKLITLSETTDRYERKYEGWNYWAEVDSLKINRDTKSRYFKPSHKVGDIIGVRERASLIERDFTTLHAPDKGLYKYEVDGNLAKWIEIPERLAMPIKGECCPNGCFKELVRTFLKVTGVRFERIQDISIEDIMAEGVTFKSMESLLMSSWGKLLIEDCYWFNGDDICGDYCQNCGQKAVEEANKALEPNAEKYILEGYERVTSDSNATCITCGVHLEYWLTEWGIESELDHFEKYLTYPYSQSEKYELYCLFESAIHSHGLNIDDWNTGKPERIELAGRLYKLAMRIVWESIYPGSWDKNEWVEIIDFIITEKPHE